MDGIIAYILSKKYTNNTVIGMGAIKGAACQVQSINKVGKTTTVTLKWEDNVGGVHTQAFDVEDGLDGVSVQNATIKPNGHLELTLSNGTVIDCGKVLPQYDTMPTPSSSNEGQILQYIGTTTSNYTNGYFYECINDGGTYKWVEKSVQDSYTKIEIGDIQNLPDNTKDVIQNINSLKLSIDQLQASKLSISDIDNALSNTSENPVQNKVIKLTIDQLRGSILDKLDEKEDKFRYSTMPTANVDYLNKIVEYIGVTDSTYTNGYFYQCRFNGTNYEWVQKNIQPSGGSTGGDGVVDGYYNSTDHLFYEENTFINPITGDDNTIYVSLDTNLLYRYNGLIFIRVDEATSGEDDVIDGYYKEADGKFYEEPTYTTEIIGETGKIYISDDTNIQYRWDGTQFVTISSSIDVDNVLSTTSENPVQNKVISLKIDQLQGSILEKIQKKLSATADDFVVFTNDGDIADSGISKDVVPSTVSVSNKLLVASDISSKANKVVGATSGDLAELDADGDLVDSGKKLSDLQGKLTDGNGIDIDASNNISLDLTYLTASKVGYIPATEKGSNNGVAELDSAGKVPSSQLPSYVDDVIEGYLDSGIFYEDNAHTIPITPESGKIYVDITTNTTYRWSGTAYVQISESLALGTTHTTAFYGDYGQTAYNHSQITNGSNPHNTTADNVNLKVPISALSGSKLDVESTLYGVNTELGKKQPIQLVTPITMLSGTKLEVESALQGLNDEKQNIQLAVPIDTLGGTKLTVEDTLNEFNTEIKTIDTDLDGKADLTDLAPEFDATVAYSKGQYVSYNGDVYKFKADHAIGAWVGTDATQIVVSNEIIGTTHLYDYNGIIANGDDLNDYKTIGNYECPNGTIAGSLSNSPVTTSAFSLQVTIRGRNLFPDSSTQPTLQQIIKNINNNDSDIWIRTLTYNGSAWGEWKRLATAYQKEIAIASNTTTSTYRNAYIKISGIPTNTFTFAKPISLLLGTSRANRYILNITPYYGSSTIIKLQAINISDDGTSSYSDILADLAYELSSTTEIGTMDIWLKIYLNTSAIRLNFSDISNITGVPYNIVSLGNDNDIYDVSTSTTNSDYFDTLTKGIISNVAYVNKVNDKVSYEDNSILGAKNFLPNDAVTTTTAQGVTYVVNDDKTVLIASGQTTTTYTNLTLGSATLPEGNYILSGCPSGGSANTYRLRLVNDSTLLGIDSGNGYSFHADGNTNYTFTIGLSANGTTYTIPSDLLFKPMVRLASDADDTYQPYAETNYQLTKNKMSYADNGILGAKNLYDTNATSKTDAYGGVWTVNDDKTITVSGTPTDYEPFSTRSYYVLPVGEYIINWNEENLVNVALDSFRLCKGNTEVRVVATNKASAFSFTITNSDDYDNIRIAFKRVTNNVAMSGIIKPMIRFASDPDNTYVPYAMTNAELTKCVTWKDV